MIVTNVGRPVGKFPMFKLRDGEGRYLAVLSRIDVSDVRNSPVAEAFYTALIIKDARDGMTYYEARIGNQSHVWIVTSARFYFIPYKRIEHYALNDHQTSEE